MRVDAAGALIFIPL